MKKLLFAIVDNHGFRNEILINDELKPILMTDGETREIFLDATNTVIAQVPISWGIFYLGEEND